MNGLWIFAPFISGGLGYLVGGWWATRLTRAERRLADRYLYTAPVSEQMPDRAGRLRG